MLCPKVENQQHGTSNLCPGRTSLMLSSQAELAADIPFYTSSVKQQLTFTEHFLSCHQRFLNSLCYMNRKTRHVYSVEWIYRQTKVKLVLG